MKPYARHLEKLRKLKRREYHPLAHKIHKKHKISRKTLFYVKEYGTHTNVPRTIIKESIKILLLASVLSSLGGLSLEHIKIVFVSIIPLVILLPALNDMLGDIGSIFSSKYSAMLHEGLVKGNLWKNHRVRKLFAQLFVIAAIMALFSSSIAITISYFSGFAMDMTLVMKIMLITMADVLILVSLIFIIATVAGIYFFKKKEDPNNFLIPITTSIADFGNMFILSLLILLVF